MTEPRRFSDDEVQRILERASVEELEGAREAGAPGSALSDGSTGMTLQQLQEIAVEAGIDPGAVARAADVVARGELAPVQMRRAMGAPVAVAKTIDLGQRVDDPTWDRMVMVLRDTFGARGRVRVEGGLREWSNGNLSAVLEPTSDGHRLRVSTRKGDASVFRALGNVGLGVSAAFTALILVRTASGGVDPGLAPWGLVALFGAGGVAAHLRNVIALRLWGRERATQMNALPERLFALLEPASTTRPPR
jgi:hypothetical protein